MGGELTILVPALNEERRLAVTVEEAIRAAQRHLAAYEVIIINDGSTDRTGEVAEELAARHPWVSVVHFDTNRGVGAAYHEGLRRARHPHLTLIPGDNAFQSSGVETVFQHVGRREMVVSYRANPRARTRMRLLLSRCCTTAMRLLTGHPIRDAHSLYVFPVAKARQVPRNTGYGYHIETLSTLLRGGVPYVEVPVLLTPRPDSSSKVMRFGVLARLMGTMSRLYVHRIIHGRAIRFHSAPFALQPRYRKAG
ncbi:MAG: glycosyltransferase family 2 protein [Gemmataceae bacterium]